MGIFCHAPFPASDGATVFQGFVAKNQTLAKLYLKQLDAVLAKVQGRLLFGIVLALFSNCSQTSGTYSILNDFFILIPFLVLRFNSRLFYGGMLKAY